MSQDNKPSVSFAISSKKKNDLGKYMKPDLPESSRSETDFIQTVENNKING